ncbi:MAG: transposase [Elusimicrobia bacterium]|nr:transposase [Elusimicrobiota bacterium]
MARGNGGRLIFKSDDDYLFFLGILAEVARKTRCSILAFCPMPDHFHLLVKVSDIPLSDIMSRLLSRYAKRFNAVHRRRGHLFQSRYKPKLCMNQTYLLTLLVYIHMNPVKEGLVSAPGDWPWSSHKQILGPVHSSLLALDETLALLADDPESARRRYAALLEEKLDGFAPTFEADLEIPPPSPPPPVLATLDEIATELWRRAGTSIRALPGTNRCPKISRLRREFTQLASDAGHANSAIAAFLGIHPTAVGQYLRSLG